MKSFMSRLKNWMNEGKITTSCLQLASYLPLTCPLHLSYAAVSRSRSVCSPRTPSLFKDKSQLSFPSLASLICLCMLTVGVGSAWGADVAVNDILIIENFTGGATSTTYSDGSNYSNSYSSITMAVPGDASGLSLSSDEAHMFNPSTSPNCMEGSHVWLGKNTAGYIEIDNIPLHNVTKFQAHWAQNNTPAVTFYYKFNGDASWTNGGNGGNEQVADATSNEITVTTGKTSVSIKFQRENNKTNQRIDKVKLVVTEIAVSCTNNVTIQKGAETNGTFTISPSGSQASCAGVAVTVTPTPASSSYYCSAVSASTGETGTDNGNGTWTVNIAANTTGTSTINVTFSLKTSYTVTWYNDGVSIATESVYSGDKVSALPSPAPTSSCSGEFVGWVRSDAAVADKSVTDAYTTQPTAPTLFTDVAGSPTITENTAFHAVYRMPKPD